MSNHESLAELFAYPGGGGRTRVQAALADLDAPLQDRLAPFARFVETTEPADLEEAYTRTFDINPVCTLEVGWHLYGEDYSRGSFLVFMRELLRLHGIEETPELPDHLTSVLAVLGRLGDDEARDFVRGQVLLAINKMLEGFKSDDDPYRVVVTVVRDWLRERYGPEASLPTEMAPSPYGEMCEGCGVVPQGGDTDG